MLSFGPRLTTVFASRWKAVWWAAGVLLTAYCSIPSADAPDSDPAVDAAIGAALGATPAPAAHPEHRNPWAVAPGKSKPG